MLEKRHRTGNQSALHNGSSGCHGLSNSKGTAFQPGILHPATTTGGPSENPVGSAGMDRKLLENIPSNGDKTTGHKMGDPKQERRKEAPGAGKGDQAGSRALSLAEASLG